LIRREKKISKLVMQENQQKEKTKRKIGCGPRWVQFATRNHQQRKSLDLSGFKCNKRKPIASLKMQV
jgi:hypothetical protein